MRRQARIEKLLQEVPDARRPPRARPRGHQGRHPRDVGADRVLRDARRALHRPVRRPRHRRPRGGASATPPRSAARRSSTCSPRRAGATARPRTTRSSACTTSAEPKPGSYTAAFTEALIKEAEAAPRAGGHHRGHARLDRPAARSRERFPDRCFDVGIAEQHAVTAAAGMAMGGLRPVVAIYSTFLTRAVRPGQPRRRPAPPAGDLLPRPGRHHRRRRPVAPRRARHDAAHQGAGHDDVRAVVVPGAAADAARRPRPSPTARCRSAGRRPRPARSRPRTSATASHGRRLRRGRRPLHHRRRQDARRRRGGRRPRSPPTACR